MKIFVDKNTNVVLNVFEDAVNIVIENKAYMVTSNGKTECYIGTQNLNVVEGVTLPEDYETLKYVYQSNEFTVNPVWDLIQDERAKEADPRLTDDPLFIQPYNSWVWNSTIKEWEAPVARPKKSETFYDWDEDNQTWVER